MTSPFIIRKLTEEFAAMQEAYYNKSPLETEQVAEPSSIDNAHKLALDADDMWARIEPEIEGSEFYMALCDGAPGSGKSSIIRELAHKAESSGFGICYIAGFDLANIQEILTSFQQKHHYEKITIAIDDVTYLMQTFSGKKQGTIKSFMTMLRHATKARVFLLIASHFNTGVPPIFKATTGAYFFTSPSTVELPFMSLVVGRDRDAQRQLKQMFDVEVALRAQAQIDPLLRFKWQGHDYKFQWGDRKNPGDGRLSLMIHQGKSLLYNSKNISCNNCKHIGKPQMVNADYSVQDKEAKAKPEQAGPPQ